jgi:erythronate-4-phosphate dehydrogenase
LKIIADENIRYVSEAFTTMGEVTLRPCREICASDVHDAEILLVRSVTQVNEALLSGSSIRFVATATIGEDHIDRGYLDRKEIGFSSAPGCNANSVGEYIVAALLHLAEKYDFKLADKSIGVIGVGNVGSNVAKKAAAMGMNVVLNDPPLAAATADAKYRPLDEILACDIVTTHVPITSEGPFPTHHLVDTDFLGKLAPGSLVINSARGPVVDNTALLSHLASGHIRGAVLDVWEGEPDINLALLGAVDIATPHIAGYSFDGKVKGTVQIYEAACHFQGITPSWSPEPLLPAPEHPELSLNGGHDDLKRLVETVYPILEDDARMRGIAGEAAGQRAAHFDMLRKTYPRRREFYNTRVLSDGACSSIRDIIHGVGFLVE